MEHKKSLIWQQDPNTLFESYFLFFSFTNIFNLVMDYTFSYLQNNHPNAPNFKIKSNCQAFSHPKLICHQNNLDATKNKGRKG